MSSAKFVGFDRTTQGTWVGAYGKLGYWLLEGAGAVASSLPPGMAVTVPGASSFSYASATADVRALQRHDGSARDANIWYSASSWSFVVAPADATRRRLRVYCVDWDHGGRAQTLKVTDTTTGSVLDSQTISGFDAGLWLSWDVSGPVTVTVTVTSGSNGVASGLFLGPAPPARCRTALAAALGASVVAGSGGSTAASSAVTLGAFTASASASPGTTAASSVAIGAFVASSSAQPGTTAASSVTLDPFVASASAQPGVTAASSVAVGAFAVSAAVQSGTTAASAVTVAPFTASASASPAAVGTVNCSSAVTVGSFTASASLQQGVTVSSSVAAGAFAASASVRPGTTVVSAVTIGAFVASASASPAVPGTASCSSVITVGPFVASASARPGTTVSSSVTIGDFTASPGGQRNYSGVLVDKVMALILTRRRRSAPQTPTDSVSMVYALDPFGAKVTPKKLKQVLGSSQTWTVTAVYQEKPKVNVFTSNDALDAKLYQGDSQAILFRPVVSWVSAAQATIKLSISAAQTLAASVTAGLYRIEIGVTPAADGNRHVALYSTIQFVGTSGLASAPASLVSWGDVLTYSSDVAKLEQQDVDQTQFAGHRAKAMGLFIQEISRRYNPRPGGSRRYVSEDGTTAGPYLRFSPSPDGSPPPSRAQVETWLAQPGRLALNEDILEANARLAAALVYGSTPGQNSPYQQMADKERGLARSAILRAKIDLDTKQTPDGNPTIRVDRDVIYLT